MDERATDIDLVMAVKRGGDEASEALKVLGKRLERTVRSLASGSGIDRAVSEAQILEGIWEAAKRFDVTIANRRGASFKTYAYPWMRKMSRPRSETKPGRLDKPFRHFFSDFPSYSEHDDGKRFQDRYLSVTERLYVKQDVDEALSSLTPDERRVVTMRFIEGNSIREIVAATGISTWNVKLLSNSAVGTLVKSLACYG